jgi:hypothetical protein
MSPKDEPRWLLLVHQIPPRPHYLRVKVARHLRRVGAVAVKNTVYVLPRSEESREAFEWVLREVTAGGGEATVCEVNFLQGVDDGEIRRQFRDARDADYREVVAETEALLRNVPRAAAKLDAARAKLTAECARLERRVSEIAAVDFFEAPGAAEAKRAIERLKARLASPEPPAAGPRAARSRPKGATWVTRSGVYVDRMACAWLIRAFIDPRARFRFVPSRGYRPKPGEQRFDMFEAEFTHEGDLCTFEVLLDRFGLSDPGLRALGQVIHDIDLQDGKFGRPETPGVERLVAGIALREPTDEGRIARASAAFEALQAALARKSR